MQAMANATAVAVVLFAAAVGSVEAANQHATRSFPNCTALNRVYPHGVGRLGARDHTSGTPVTSFKRSNILYRQNIGRDADHDGIACEKR